MDFMLLGEYLRDCVASRPSSQRPGQWTFNLLTSYNPVVAEKVRGTHLDPFHDQSKLPEFFAFVCENWAEV